MPPRKSNAKNLTVREFASQIGVAPSTVSRAINNKGEVHPETRAMVLRRMDELGFRPNRTAAALASGRTGVAALWVAGLNSPYASRILIAMEKEVEEHDLDLVVVDVERKREDPARLAELLLWPCDAVIVLDGFEWLGDVVSLMDKPPVPMINIGVNFNDCMDHIQVDLETPMGEAVRHTAAAGCRRIAYLTPDTPEKSEKGSNRLRGYTEAMDELGFEHEVIFCNEAYRSITSRVVTEYVQRRGCPEAILCYNDNLAIAAHRSLRELRCNIPKDVLVVGCDGIEEGEYIDPPLSTIVQPIEEACALAWDFLSRRMANPDHPRQSACLASALMIRGSSSR